MMQLEGLEIQHKVRREICSETQSDGTTTKSVW